MPGQPLNATVVEVKAATASPAGLLKDLGTLAAFEADPESGYAEGILLVFGEVDRQQLTKRVSAAARHLNLTDEWERIWVWTHDAVCAKAEPLGAMSEFITR